MLIITARLRRSFVVLGVAGLVLLCGALAASGILFHTDTATAAVVSESQKVKTNDDRISYLESFGWTVEPEAIAVEELRIPKSFDSSYDEYLAIQTEQGFDLTKFEGKKVKRYTYLVTNYPTGEENVQAALLVYKDAVIGGEVLSSQSGGFVHGLPMPAEK